LPFLADPNSPAAIFNVTVYVDENDTEGKQTAYSTLEEAQAAFERLEASGSYPYGGLYKWSANTGGWDCLDAWPEDWDGE
jgi:hypothetical protein